MKKNIIVGIIGDFEPDRVSHKATVEAIKHCASHLNINVEIGWNPSEDLEKNAEETIRKYDGIWCAPGVYKSSKGAINGIKVARLNDIPFIATCGGFQQTVLEYARNVLGLADVHHAEYNKKAANLIITPLSCSLVGETRSVFIKEKSIIYQIYKKNRVEERFSCNLGINPAYRKTIEDSALKIAGVDKNDEVRILMLEENKFYVTTLFQPQLSSSSENPHELIIAFIQSMVH